MVDWECDAVIATLKSLKKKLEAQTAVVRETGSVHMAAMAEERRIDNEYRKAENKLLSHIAGEERYAVVFRPEEP